MTDPAGKKAIWLLKGLALKLMLELDQIEKQSKDQTWVNIRLPRKEAKELVDIILEI